jgi:uncharacterized RDD family membrane protein YckC
LQPVLVFMRADRAMRRKLTNEEAEAFVRQWIYRLPPRPRRAIVWLLRPRVRWLRVVIALLLIVASVFWFLPVLGLWMLPLGLLLLAEDIPPLRRWVVQNMLRLHAWWENRKR